MNRKPNRSLKTRPGTERGFALVVTVSLMVLLAVVAVGMLSLSAVTLRASSRGLAMQEARSNARLALSVAMGQLQSSLGPDRAVSAPAGAGILEDKDLVLGSTTPKAALRNYVGVWEAAKNPRDSDGKFVFDSPSYPKDGKLGQPNLFKGWLVSNADPDKIDSEDFFDGATSTDSIDFDEVKATGQSSASSEEPVYLVHTGSVEDASGYIKAGTVPILKSNNSIAGRYAYWVGDNNQKMLINTRDIKLRNGSANGGDHLVKMATPGPHGLDAFSSLSAEDGGFTLDTNSEESDRIITLKELQLANGVDTASLKKNFHDITTVADSVLANVTSGSLRKDLSLFFEGDPESGDWAGYKLRSNAPIGPYGQEALSNHDEYDTAPWSMLRQFYRMGVAGKEILNSSRGSLVAPDALVSSNFSKDDYPGWNKQRLTLSPVIARASLILAVGATDINTLSAGQFRKKIAQNDFPPIYNGLRPVKDPKSTAENPKFIRNNYLLNFSSYPVVTLWNPYSLPMEVPGFSIRFHGSGTQQIVTVDRATEIVSYHWGVPTPPDAQGRHGSRVAGRGIYHESSFTLKPGETRTFAADVAQTPDFSRSLFFKAKELKSPRDLNDLVTGKPPWNGGFLYNAPDKTKNADHDNRDVYNDPNVTFSLWGSTAAIFADANSMVQIQNTEFLPQGETAIDKEPNVPGHQGLMNYETFSSFEIEMLCAARPSGVPLWRGWDRNKDSSKSSGIIAWRMDEGGPVSVSSDLGSGPFQVPPFQMSLITNGTRRPFMSVDLRLKSAENAGSIDRYFNPNCTWLHNIPGMSYTGMTDHGTRKTLGTNVSDSDINTAALAHPYTMRFFSTPNYNDFFSTVHPLERHDGYMVPFIGRSYSGAGGTKTSGQRRMVATEIPMAPLQSIAQFAHVPMLPIDATRWSNIGIQNLAVGNSYANPLIDDNAVVFPEKHPGKNSTSTSWSGWRTWLNLQQNNASSSWNGYSDLDGVKWIPKHVTDDYNLQMPTMRFVDRSYVANTLLWDDFFFSGFSDYQSRFYRSMGGQSTRKESIIEDFVTNGDQLPNTTFRLAERGVAGDQIISDLESDEGYRKAASYMKVAGGFNINSLSVKAWKAFLASNLKRKIPVLRSDGRAQSLSSFEESSSDTYEISRFTAPIETEGNPETKWTEYNTVDEDDLEDLAEKIVAEVAKRGPFRSLGEFVNRRVEKDSSDTELATKGALQAALDNSTINEDLVEPSDMISSSDISNTSYRFPEAAQQSRYAGTPEYVMQSDLLRSIGPAIQARSDSFTIRAYGESSDGEAKVWCEALVTRSIDFVDPDSNSAEDEFADLNPVNKKFGRQFKVVSFRWLAQNEV